RGITGSRADVFADPDAVNRTSSASGGNSGNRVGSLQQDGVGSHQHFLYVGSLSLSLGNNGSSAYNSSSTIHNASYVTSTCQGIGNETRPKNAYVNYIIKY